MRTGSDNIHARNWRYRIFQSRSSVPASASAPDTEEDWLPPVNFFGVLVAVTVSSFAVPANGTWDEIRALPSIRMGVVEVLKSVGRLRSPGSSGQPVCFTFRKSVEDESEELPDSIICPETKTKLSLFRAMLRLPSSSFKDNWVIARPGSSIRSGCGELASLATSPICRRRVPHLAMAWYNVCSLLGSSRNREKKLFQSSMNCA